MRQKIGSFLAMVVLATFFITMSASPAAAEWFVYRDAGYSKNHGEWTNFFDKHAGEMLSLVLADRTDPHSGDTAVKVNVSTFKEPNWCGVAVASSPDYWGTKEQGDQPFFDLSQYKTLRFWGRGAKGGETLQIKVAIAGDQPFGDSAKIPFATHWITLTKTWTEYKLSVDGSLKRVITPFAFVVDKSHNPNGPFTFFLDDIRFE